MKSLTSRLFQIFKNRQSVIYSARCVHLSTQLCTEDLHQHKIKYFENEEQVTPIKTDFSHLIKRDHLQTLTDVPHFRDENGVACLNKEHPTVLQFSDIEFPQYIKNWIKESGFEHPTTVQSHVWPTLLSGKNLFALGPIGSGKTLAYILPGLINIGSKDDATTSKGPKMLVLAPTFPLCHQIATVIQQITKDTGLVAKHLTSFSDCSNIDICVSIPKIMKEAVLGKHIDLSQCSYCVYDEFYSLIFHQPKIFLKELQPETQIVLVSDYWKPSKNDKLRMVSDLQKICFHSTKPADQEFITCPTSDMAEELLKILRSHPEQRIIIFTNSADTSEELDIILGENGFAANKLHRRMGSNEVVDNILGFNSGMNNILISTNLGSSGINYTDVDIVINYDVPRFLNDFHARIGLVKLGKIKNLIPPESNFTERELNSEKLLELELLRAHEVQKGGKTRGTRLSESTSFHTEKLANSNPLEIVKRLEILKKDPEALDIMTKELFLLLLPRHVGDVVSTARKFATLEQLAEMAESLMKSEKVQKSSQISSLEKECNILKNRLDRLKRL